MLPEQNKNKGGGGSASVNANTDGNIAITGIGGRSKTGMSEMAVATPSMEMANRLELPVGHVFTLEDCGKEITRGKWWGMKGITHEAVRKRIVAVIKAPNGNVLAITEEANEDVAGKAVMAFIEANQ